MSDCNHQCSSCSTSSGCQEKEQNERVINNTKGVRSVIGVVGGKGGVGKSLVTSLLAIQTQRLGYRAAVRSEERRVGKEGRSRWSPYH